MTEAAFDLTIRNGRLSTASDTFPADIGIKNGRIAALAASLPAGARDIDASGRCIDSRDDDRVPSFKGTKLVLTPTDAGLGSAARAYLAKIGEAHMSYGDYPKAIEVLQAALTKGIASPEEAAFARLHLGIAQYRAGQADAARATWAEVKSDNGATVLAQNWTLISKIKA